MAAPRLRAAEDAATVRKAFAVGACLVVGVAPGEGSVETFLPVLVLILGGEVQAHLLRGAQPLRLVSRRPVTLVARLAVFVDVVGISEGREACVVGVVESEEAAQVAVVGAQSALDVGQQSAVVLTLQLHVHDVVLLRCFLTLPFALFRRLVVDLHILYRVVR